MWAGIDCREGEMMELKPCPFCGNKTPLTWWDGYVDGVLEGYNIECCHVHICSVSMDVAIEIWNTRYQPPYISVNRKRLERE